MGWLKISNLFLPKCPFLLRPYRQQTIDLLGRSLILRIVTVEQNICSTVTHQIRLSVVGLLQILLLCPFWYYFFTLF